MATQLTVLPYQSERMYRSRTFLLSILQKTVRGRSINTHPHLLFICLASTSVNNSRCRSLSVKNTADGARSDGPKSSKNTTRLIRTVQSLQRKLSSRIKDLRNGLSVKVLFFLVGFYCATAFATVIGQTGDWDILSAGLAVVVVEGIGAVTYRSSSRFFGKVRRLVAAFNYWKAGLTLGLFLDSFKYEMDSLLEKYNLFNIDTDIFQILL
ncbi:Ycf20-like protein [Platanthera zijinensis]|uniref:Ycf20-like protein n=1 Tax=Platanthera zijinensis TaxID=2320716 RepID=A0AAP0G8U2_9ASPA